MGDDLVNSIANLSGQVVGLRQERDLATRLIEQLKAQAEVDTAALATERALADDLAHWLDIFADADHDEVMAVMARYREARK